MKKQLNQFYRGIREELVTIPLTNSDAWLNKQIYYAKRQMAAAGHPDAKQQYAEYIEALEGALQLKQGKICANCNGRVCAMTTNNDAALRAQLDAHKGTYKGFKQSIAEGLDTHKGE